MELDDERLRRLVVEQVQLQLVPFKEDLTDLVNRFRSFYRNGDAGLPGFFDNRIQIDDDRYAVISKRLDKQDTKLDDIDKKLTYDAGADGAVEKRKKSFWERAAVIVALLGLLVAVVVMLIGLASLAYSIKIRAGEMPAPELIRHTSQHQDMELAVDLPQNAAN